MPPRVPPKHTVALCGLRADVTSKDIEDALKQEAILPACLDTSGIAKIMKDKFDTSTDMQRRIVFLNCKSKDAASKACAALNRRKVDTLGMEKYGKRLQAVIKHDLRSVDWKAFQSTAIKTVEGAISKKRNVDCFIEHPMSVWVSMDVFEGSDDAWRKLKVGDVLRVEAEEDNYNNGKDEIHPWKATEAALVSKSKSDPSSSNASVRLKMRKEAEEMVLADAETMMGEVLSQNLRGRGWVSLGSIGGWFNTTPQVKEALAMIKEKHKQLKNFVASSPLVEMRQDGSEFLIALQEDLTRERHATAEAMQKKRDQEEQERRERYAAAAAAVAADIAEAERKAVAAKTAAEAERLRRDAEAARLKRQHEEEERRKKEKAEEETHRRQCENELKKQQEESLRARMAAADAALATEDETKEEQDGRARCYRIQRAVLELTPTVLTSVLHQAWKQKTGQTWSPGSSGKELKDMMKNIKDVEKRVGRGGLPKLVAGETEKFDITFFAILLVDDPALLSNKSDEAKAIRGLRSLRNLFVHELHLNPTLTLQVFDEKWREVIKLLEPLAKYAGQNAQQLLESEQKKILTQAVDAKKEREFAEEFNMMRDQLEELEERQSNVEGQVAGMKQNMVTMSRAESMVSRKVEAKMEALLAKMQVQQEQKSEQGLLKQVTLSASSLLQQASHAAATVRGKASASVTLSNNLSYTFDPSKPLGKGNQGAVFAASSTQDGSLIALKLAEKKSSRDDREYINLEMIKHPSVVGVLGHGIVKQGVQEYIAIGMELVVGESYEDYLKANGGKIDWQSAAEDFRQIVTGMQAVHRLQVVHRDLKPANLMRKKNGLCIIVDFGLSKNTTNAMGTASMTGAFKGTPAYSAPEVSLGSEHVTLSTDVFAMGVIFYEAVSGFLPFSASQKDSKGRSTAASILNTRAVNLYQLNTEGSAFPLTEDEAPTQINEFILKCLEADKNNRFASADEMLDPWDEANAAVLNVVLEKAEQSEAAEFWTKHFGSKDDELGLEVSRFQKVFCEQFSISEAAGKKLSHAVDINGDGTLTREEFLETFSSYGMVMLAKKFAEEAEEELVKAAAPEAAGEPTNSYHGKGRRLVFTDVKFKSKGTMLGGSKDRIGSISLQNGRVEVRRFDGGQSIVVYTFDTATCLATCLPGLEAIDLIDPQKYTQARGARRFTFDSISDCKSFESAFNATKNWITG